MKKSHVIVLGIIILAVLIFIITKQNDTGTIGDRVLKVGIAPYQDMALLMNADRENIEKKHDLNVEYTTLAWEDLVPAVSSAQDTIDVAFASLTWFVTNERNVNKNTTDPLVYFYPGYIFLGGSFVSFNPNVPVITKADLNNPEKLKSFLKLRFAAEEKSFYEQMLFILAQKAGVDFKTVKITHIGLADALLAAINGSVDVVEAGLTQRNEALEKNGKVVLDSADMGLADISGFVAKKSVLKEKKAEIEDFMKIWFDSTNYVLSDINNRAAEPIAFLDATSATKYTVESFRQALAQERFPRNIAEVRTLILNEGSEWDFKALQKSLTDFQLTNGIIIEAPQNIEILEIQP